MVTGAREAGYIASTAKKQREANAGSQLTFSFVFSVVRTFPGIPIGPGLLWLTRAEAEA